MEDQQQSHSESDADNQKIQKSFQKLTVRKATVQKIFRDRVLEWK